MNRRKLDKILVVDLEATCWDGPTPEGQLQEILEIGTVWLDTKTFVASGKQSLLITPTVSTITAFCTSLTSITTQMVAHEGIAFPSALQVLQEQYVDCYGWASYGDFDRALFARQCEHRGLPYPFSSRHTNIKHLYALLTGASREVGMAKALEQIGVSLLGTHHRAHDDAENTAILLGWCLKHAREGISSLSKK